MKNISCINSQNLGENNARFAESSLDSVKILPDSAKILLDSANPPPPPF